MSHLFLKNQKVDRKTTTLQWVGYKVWAHIPSLGALACDPPRASPQAGSNPDHWEMGWLAEQGRQASRKKLPQSPRTSVLGKLYRPPWPPIQTTVAKIRQKMNRKKSSRLEWINYKGWGREEEPLIKSLKFKKKLQNQTIMSRVAYFGDYKETQESNFIKVSYYLCITT